MGIKGTPEYGRGKDFEEALSDDYLLWKEEFELTFELEDITKINLDRQIGSRYFVTEKEKKGANQTLNLLEQTVKDKLEGMKEIIGLWLYALFYDKIFGDFMILVKSTKLNNNALTINQYFLEVRNFLFSLEEDASLLFNQNFKVFSVDSLYNSSDLNHRNGNMEYWNFLYKRIPTDDVLQQVSSCAKSMREKSECYLQDRLPGGKYFNPSPEVADIMKSIPTSNDFCESAFGLNDNLRTNTFNLSQFSAGAVTISKKNKTSVIIRNLDQKTRGIALSIAQKRKQQLQISSKLEEKKLKVSKRAKKENERTLQAQKEKKRMALAAATFTSQNFKTFEEFSQQLQKEKTKTSKINLCKIEIRKRTNKLLETQINKKKLQEKGIQTQFSEDGKQICWERLEKEIEKIFNFEKEEMEEKEKERIEKKELTEIAKKIEKKQEQKRKRDLENAIENQQLKKKKN